MGRERELLHPHTSSCRHGQCDVCRQRDGYPVANGGHWRGRSPTAGTSLTPFRSTRHRRHGVLPPRSGVALSARRLRLRSGRGPHIRTVDAQQPYRRLCVGPGDTIAAGSRVGARPRTRTLGSSRRIPRRISLVARTFSCGRFRDHHELRFGNAHDVLGPRPGLRNGPVRCPIEPAGRCRCNSLPGSPAVPGSQPPRTVAGCGRGWRR